MPRKPRPIGTNRSTGVQCGACLARVLYPLEFIDEYDAGEAAINFGVGSRRQTIEIAGFEVLHYAATYPWATYPRPA